MNMNMNMNMAITMSLSPRHLGYAIVQCCAVNMSIDIKVIEVIRRLILFNYSWYGGCKRYTGKERDRYGQW